MTTSRGQQREPQTQTGSNCEIWLSIIDNEEFVNCCKTEHRPQQLGLYSPASNSRAG